ncbi:MAG: PASTA domain-containing protein [Dethiobacter sp.]|jgi:LCP family protein required for cell wall assembly|nr:PASTA domain-containing protein [Dethiobacter sp.]
MKITGKIKNLRPLISKYFNNAAAYVKERSVKVYAYLKRKKRYVIVGSFALPVVTAAAYVAITFIQITDPARVLLGDGFSSERTYSVGEEFAENIVNIAILGFDRDAEREKYAFLFLPDFIGVLTINFGTGDINLVRILRDSYVPMSATGVKDKINHSFYHGYMYGGGTDRNEAGLRGTLDTISLTLGGVPIQYYVSLDMDGLVYVVNAIGGIEYRVGENLYDRFGRRLLKKGTHHFNGEQFLALIRHRDDQSGQDVGRTVRQFDILDDLFENFRDKGLLRNIPTMFKVYRDHIKTNLGLRQVAALAYYVRNFDPTQDIFHVLEGTNQSKDGIYYWVLNQAQRVSLIRQVFGITVPAWPQEVLTDTPPPPLKFFEYEILIDEDGAPSVALTWEPGDAKKVVYELYRNGELLEELESTYYLDEDVEFGEDYDYRLVVRHFRAEGPPGSLSVYLVPPMVAVPDVAGMTAQDARRAIEAAGFRFGVSPDEFHETVPDDKAIYTLPAAGTMAAAGSIVTVVMSDGPPPPEPEKVQIPANIIGMTEVDARAKLEGLGFVVVIQEEPAVSAKGTVIRTNPDAGTSQLKGSIVTLFVSKGPEEPQG